MSGIKWIGSYPANIKKGIPRASAVLILNDFATGYPIAMMEAATISSNRTAASAVLAAQHCWPGGEQVSHLSFIGAGIISRAIFSTMIGNGWSIDCVSVFDLNVESSKAFCDFVNAKGVGKAEVVDTLEEALTVDLVVFATSAGTPYVTAPDSFRPGQVILNISLRDIAPELIIEAENIFDDIEHCLKANTSPHLAEQLSGSRNFITGTIADLAQGKLELSYKKPIVVSPFGMGILDIALARFVFSVALDQGEITEISGFFGELERWPICEE